MYAVMKVSLALTLFALIVVAVPAQQPPAQGAQPVQQGAQPVQGAPPVQTGLPPTIGNPLFRMPEVRRELTINEQQFGRLNEAFDPLRTRFQTDFGRLGQLDERARAARLNELQQNFNTEFLRSAGGILNEQQMNRLRQLELQRRGFDIFTDADIARRFNLTADQSLQLRRLQEQAARQEQEILQGAQTNRDLALQRFNDFRRQTQERTNAILNEQQRRAFRELTGNSFNFPPNFPPANNPVPPRP